MAARRFVFTLNNPASNEIDFARTPLIKYASWQLEKGASGTPHLQGYVELSRPQRFSYFRDILAGAHFEIARGSPTQARDYTRKEDSRLDGPWEYGQFTDNQGSRSDLMEIKRKLDEGMEIEQIADEHFGSWNRYRQSFIIYRGYKQPKRTSKTKVTVLFGPPGTGKSYYAHQRGPVYMVTSKSYPWFDGYNGTDAVLFDDFYGWVPFHHLLTLLDAYPTQVQIKGGFQNWNPKEIFITSNRSPEQWYKDENLEQRALMRRITEIKEMLITYNEDDVIIIE